MIPRCLGPYGLARYTGTSIGRPVKHALTWKKGFHPGFGYTTISYTTQRCSWSIICSTRNGLKQKVVNLIHSPPVRSLTTTVTAQPVAEISHRARKIVGSWLIACSGMAFGSVILGGATRLTKSGLSMVDWHPFKEFPPLTLEQWEAEFQKYQQYPEYKIMNREMTLSEFKRIWYIEYLHRTWGRTIGAVYYLPAIYFWHKGWLTKAMKPRVIAFGGLLALQGLLGWYMVKSGLEEKKEPDGIPRVSQYRLAVHLAAAFIFYSLLLWNGLSHLLPPQPTTVTPKMRTFWKCAHGTKSLIFIAAFTGAFVAGIEAGLVYNSFPKMGDHWVPADLLALSPSWRNITENPTTVQFDHRLMGESVAAAVTGLWWFSRKLPLPPRARLAVNCLFAVGLLQVTLGIATLLLYVPKPLAATHQAGALTTLTMAVWLTHELKLLRRIRIP